MPSDSWNQWVELATGGYRDEPDRREFILCNEGYEIWAHRRSGGSPALGTEERVRAACRQVLGGNYFREEGDALYFRDRLRGGANASARDAGGVSSEMYSTAGCARASRSWQWHRRQISTGGWRTSEGPHPYRA